MILPGQRTQIDRALGWPPIVMAWDFHGWRLQEGEIRLAAAEVPPRFPRNFPGKQRPFLMIVPDLSRKLDAVAWLVSAGTSAATNPSFRLAREPGETTRAGYPLRRAMMFALRPEHLDRISDGQFRLLSHIRQEWQVEKNDCDRWVAIQNHPTLSDLLEAVREASSWAYARTVVVRYMRLHGLGTR